MLSAHNRHNKVFSSVYGSLKLVPMYMLRSTSKCEWKLIEHVELMKYRKCHDMSMINF